MAENFVAVIWYVMGVILILGPFVLWGLIAARRKETKELEEKSLRSKQIREMANAMEIAQQQNLEEAGKTLSGVGLKMPRIDKTEIVLPEIFWEIKIYYMARTLITLVNLYLFEHGPGIKAHRDTLAVILYRGIGEQIKEWAEKDINKALSLVVELSTRDKRAAQGLNYCFLGKYAEEIYG